MMPAMAPWNVSSGDALTIEQRPRRSPTRWLHEHGLRIAFFVGLVEAVFAWAEGYKLVMMLIGVLSVVGYLQVRHRLPELVRRPLWVVVMAQAIAGILLPAVYLSLAVAVIVGGIMLLILALFMLGDLRR
jgi:hypothetical protein